MSKSKLYYYKKFIIYKIKQLIEYIYITYLKSTLTNKDFTIVSNNCIAGSIYEDLHIEYRTPTVGLFFFAPCYIKFISELKKNIDSELRFTNSSRYAKGNELRANSWYPIGLLNNEIEIHFLHYQSEEEAYLKWERRKERINWKNLFLIFTDNEGYSLDEVKKFDSIKYPKVFFSAKKIDGIKCLVHLNNDGEHDNVGNLYDNRWNYRKHFNVVKWLNKSKN